MAERISQESEPERWKALMRQWQAEHQPGYLVTGNTTYRVLRLSTGIVFEPMHAESLYESTSGV